MSSIEHHGPLVDLVDVSRVFATGAARFTALDRVRIQIRAGEFVAVVGRSGSGKSTLLHLIAGIDRPTGGEVHVAGTRIDRLREGPLASWRGRHVGVVFQSFQLLPTLTIVENVMMPIDFAGTAGPAEARARAMRLLADVGIADQAHKLPATLSGGQQQRAAIARALANDPPLIVADEPTGNLDSHTSTAVIALLRRLSDAGKTVVMVTHDRDAAGDADRIIALADGRVADEVARAA